jgi:hypothetical protein
MNNFVKPQYNLSSLASTPSRLYFSEIYRGEGISPKPLRFEARIKGRSHKFLYDFSIAMANNTCRNEYVRKFHSQQSSLITTYFRRVVH